MAGQIFICYRRDDTGHAAGRLHAELQRHYRGKQLFLDVTSIEPGADFVAAIEAAKIEVLLALIGKDWLDARDRNGNRRLGDPDDMVRREIAAALRRGIKVIPVLIDDAIMPTEAELPPDIKQLAKLNALKLRHDPFQRDTAALVAALAIRPQSETTNQWSLPSVALIATLLSVLSIVATSSLPPFDPAPSPISPVPIWPGVFFGLGLAIAIAGHATIATQLAFPAVILAAQVGWQAAGRLGMVPLVIAPAPQGLYASMALFPLFAVVVTCALIAPVYPLLKSQHRLLAIAALAALLGLPSAYLVGQAISAKTFYQSGLGMLLHAPWQIGSTIGVAMALRTGRTDPTGQR